MDVCETNSRRHRAALETGAGERGGETRGARDSRDVRARGRGQGIDVGGGVRSGEVRRIRPVRRRQRGGGETRTQDVVARGRARARGGRSIVRHRHRGDVRRRRRRERGDVAHDEGSNTCRATCANGRPCNNQVHPNAGQDGHCAWTCGLHKNKRPEDLRAPEDHTQRPDEEVPPPDDGEQSDADLVVIGKRGNNADFEKGHLGSNLERVVRSCQHPVLVSSRAFEKMDNFVLAFDGGKSAQKAVDYAANEALLKGMHCYLLYVGSGNAKIAAALAAAKAQLETAGFEVSVEQREGEPEKMIGDVVAQDHINLLVMGAYGHSSIRQLIVGSTTSEMIRTVKIPVLLFR